jgi:hypothetical protein
VSARCRLDLQHCLLFLEANERNSLPLTAVASIEGDTPAVSSGCVDTHIFGLARACTDWEQTLCWLSLCSGCMLWEIRRVGAEAVQEAVPVHSTGNSSMDSEADDGRRRQRFPFCNLKDVKLEALLAALLRSAPRCCPFGMVLQQLSPAHPHLHVSGDQDGDGCADVRAVWCRQLARFAGRS